MLLLSRYAGWGRGFWLNIYDGTISARTKDKHLHARVRNGLVEEQTTRTKDECTTLRYGQDCKTKKGGKTVREEYFEPGTLQAIRRGTLWKRETGIPFCRSEGKIECYSTSSGAYGKEVFTYANGNLGYIATRWRKKLQVRRPNGKLWIVIKGKVSLNWDPIAKNLDPDSTDIGLWYRMRGANWDITVYNASGSEAVTQGHVENRQKQGKWLEDGKVSYYMSGVKVSRKLYEGDPDEWDGRDVLRIPNAQVRCSLLNRMGYDKLLEKVKHKIIDKSDDGGQLLEIDTGFTGDSSARLDKIMRLVKVICPSTQQVYVLRVPPEIGRFEQARQWTFGLQEAGIRAGAHLNLVKET